MRLIFTKGLLLFFLFAVALRLCYWQVVKADELSADAEQQHLTSEKIPAFRGNILFSNGATLAGTKPTFTLFAQPKNIKDTDKPNIALSLAQIIIDSQQDPNDQDPSTHDQRVTDLKNDFLDKLRQDLFWVSLTKNLDYDVQQKIAQLNFTGIGFDQTSTRFYPEGSSSANLLGFVASDAKGENTGYFGVEGFYDGELKGLAGEVTSDKAASGLPILTGDFFENQAQNGKDLVLNIDQTIQYTVEQYLKDGIEKFGAKAASAIVMDPKTGAVLALANYPNYDPATYTDFPKEYFKDSAVADQYEPGSTFKVLVMAGALNENVVKPDTQCDACSGPVSIGGYEIKTWDNNYFPNTTMTDTIIHSDNTGMVFVSKKLGLDKLYDYIDKFGFGQSTGIDLQDEASPDLRPKDQWHDIDVATASFGQGIAVTPIQMIRAVSAIANGGYLMEPHMVKEIKDGDKTYDIQPKIVRQVISQDTAKQVTEMMVRAVNEGEAKAFRLKGFNIAGKTGTAQIPVAGHYDPTHTIASFVGFAPADDPKFIMLIRYDEPAASIYGSETAAPTFFQIAKDLFSYFKIPPSE